MLSHLLLPLLALAQQTPPTAPSDAPKVVAPAKPADPKPQDPKQDSKPVEKSPVASSSKRDGKKPSPADDPKPRKDELPSPDLTKEQQQARELGPQALALFKTNQYAKAIELANKALELDPEYDLAARVLGWSAVATGDDRKAEQLLTRALNLSPSDNELQFMLAGCHKRLQEWGAAKDLLTDLMKREGASQRILLEMGACCMGEEDFDGALAVYEHARGLAPKSRDVVEAIVAVHEAKEDWDKAAAELLPLIAASPKDAALRYRLVQEYLNGSRLADAAKQLEDTATVLADDPQPHKILEQLYAGPFPDEQRLQFHRDWLKEWNLRRR
jgi:tetratricopeptide (TPR) repeat protein